MGATALVDGKKILVGGPDFFPKYPLTEDMVSDLAELRSAGKTIVMVANEGAIIGYIALRDEIRAEAKQMVDSLHQQGLHVAMLSGDSEGSARAVAAEVGIDEVRAGLRPSDKSEAIKELRKKYGPIAMIGDGINDAPALAEADVGIAMGVAGTDIAIDTADVALMNDDLSLLPFTFNTGRHSNQIGRQNIVFSLIVLAIMIPLALTGFLGIIAAIVLHETTELMAVGNGVRNGTDHIK
jgi:Cd2+/Zn2+-exporting ATPase